MNTITMMQTQPQAQPQLGKISKRKHRSLWFRALHPFRGQEQQNLSFEAGALIVVVDHQKANVNGWGWGFVYNQENENSNGTATKRTHRSWGWFPVAYVEPTAAPKKSQQKSSSNHDHANTRPPRQTTSTPPFSTNPAPSPTSIADLWSTTDTVTSHGSMTSEKNKSLQTPNFNSSASRSASPSLTPWNQQEQPTQQQQNLAFDPFSSMSGAPTNKSSSPNASTTSDSLLSLAVTPATTSIDPFSSMPTATTMTSTSASMPPPSKYSNNNAGIRTTTNVATLTVPFTATNQAQRARIQDDDDDEEFGFGSGDMILGGTGWQGDQPEQQRQGVSTSRGFGGL